MSRHCVGGGGMRVLLFSDVQRKGGAGIAAHRLARALIDHGHEVLWATPFPDTTSDIPTANCRDYPSTSRLSRRVALTLRPGQKQVIDTQSIRHRLRQVISRFRPDVINVHNLHGADLPATLPAELSRETPVVWTLHDMWAFTGTCAYSMGCRSFESACTFNCPMADEYPVSNVSHVPFLYQQRRSAMLKAGRIAFATPSHWLAKEARHSMLRDRGVRAIANSVELDIFKPINQDAARHALELPLDRPVLVTTAHPCDPRKGSRVLYDAMAGLDKTGVVLLQLGGDISDSVHGRSDHRVLTGLHDPRLLRLAYCAADAHVLPTLADNLPNTLLEAAACGVPSIASDVGGVGEAIRHCETGWLVEPGDPGALALAITRAINVPEKESKQRRIDCRTHAENAFSPAKQVEEYIELFQDTISQRIERELRMEAA